MIIPAIMAAMAVAKMATDGYSQNRADRANRRTRHRQEDNEATQEHDARRAAIMNSLGVGTPAIRHQLKPLGHGADISGSQTLGGLFGLGSNLLASYAANQAPEAPGGTDVPLPYKQQDFSSIYGPGSLIKPGTPYR